MLERGEIDVAVSDLSLTYARNQVISIFKLQDFGHLKLCFNLLKICNQAHTKCFEFLFRLQILVEK